MLVGRKHGSRSGSKVELSSASQAHDKTLFRRSGWVRVGRARGEGGTKRHRSSAHGAIALPAGGIRASAGPQPSASVPGRRPPSRPRKVITVGYERQPAAPELAKDF